MSWLKEVQDAQIRGGKIKEPSGVPVKCIKCGDKHTLILGNGRYCSACKTMYWKDKED